ncbi:16S rRNA pseudouridine516 synthase [Eubacterium ruminantium]|nr:16S rRNA pseudouridine516 synthase [Eubacterium ruminantium]
MLIRLDKFLADTGYGTRSNVKQFIKKNAVLVDNVKVTKPDVKVDTEKTVVSVNGKEVRFEEFEYYMMNKPAGVISASNDEREKTVVDLISEKKRRDLFPVGRLDRDTVGLLIITNDGKLSQKLLAPGKHVEKVYLVKVTGKLDEEDVKAFSEGLDIGDEKLTKPAGLSILEVYEAGKDAGTEKASSEEIYEDKCMSTEFITEAHVTLTEGRFHQVKRMFEARGHEVIFLKRLSMGSLKLDEKLSEGEYRRLTPEEITSLRGGI